MCVVSLGNGCLCVLHRWYIQTTSLFINNLIGFELRHWNCMVRVSFLILFFFCFAQISNEHEILWHLNGFFFVFIEIMKIAFIPMVEKFFEINNFLLTSVMLVANFFLFCYRRIENSKWSSVLSSLSLSLLFLFFTLISIWKRHLGHTLEQIAYVHFFRFNHKTQWKKK